MAFDSKNALNHAIKYLTEAAHKRAAGGWIPPKEEEKRKKEAAKAQEKHQKLLSKQFPTHYMPEVGRQVMQKGGVPETDLGGDIITKKLAAPTEFMRGMDLEANVPQFATGAPQLTPPQAGGAPPVAPKTVTLQQLASQAGMTPKEYGERFTALKKPATPFEEWRYTEAPNAALRERKVFDVNQFKPGDVIVPLVGDLTSAGKRIANINDIKMANPLITEGGESYMRSTPDIWASGKSIISGIYNKANKALESSRQSGAKEPSAYGIHVGMAPVAGDFSTHTAEGILGLLPTAKILSKDVKKFDQFMKTPTAEYPGLKDWPGLKSDKLYDYLMAQNAGKARIKFSKGMDKAEWRDLGFPDVGPVRFASTEQMLGGMPTGTTGLSIGRIASENAISKNPESIHRSYPVSLRGTYVGGLSIPLARDIIFKDWSDRFNANAPAKNFESAKNKSYANEQAYQVITNKWLDMINKELEAAKNKKAYGGAVQGYADGGTPDDSPETSANQPYDLGQQLQRGAQILGGTAQAQYERYGAPIVTGIQELMRPVYEGGTQESYTNPEMVGRAMDVVGGLGAGSLLTGPAAAETGVLRSGMGPVAREAVAQPQRSLSPLGFYSAAAERASALQPSGDAAQMIAALKNTQGLKTEELMNAGLIDAAGNVHPEWAGRGKVTREDLVSHLQGQMPQVEETVLGRTIKGQPYPEEYTKMEQSIIDKYKPELDALDKQQFNYSLPQGTRLIAQRKMEELRDKMYAEIDATLPPDREQLLEAAKDITVPTKYQDYTLPGGENYREVLLRLPEQQKKSTEYPVIRPDGLVDGRYDSIQNAARRALEINGSVGDPINTDRVTGFRSPHWSDLNVLAHIRMADRTGPNGEKILHVEELQSDWGQKGKKEGFKGQNGITPEEEQEYFKLQGMHGGDRTETQQNRLDDLVARMDKQSRSVPSAPYVTSTEGWTDLALKRVLKEAAEGGYDKVVWTPGAEQAKRYDLSRHVDKIEYQPETKTLVGVKDGKPVFDQTVEPQKIEDYVGKDVAKKLLEQPITGEDMVVGGFHSLSGQDLSVGGEGMKGYYDSIVPKRLQNLAKKHDKDAKVGYHNISDKYHVVTPNGQNITAEPVDSEEHASDLIRTLGRDNPLDLSVKKVPFQMLGLDITPAMRESILRGQSAYQRGGAVQGYDNGGSIGIGGMAAFGDPSKGPDEYGVTTPMEAPGNLLGNMSPEQRQYIVSEMVKQIRANPESTANSPLAAGIESYDVDAAQARDDVRRAEQQALRDAAVQRAAGTTIAEKTPQATGMFAPPAETTAFGSGIRDVGFPSAEMTPFAKSPVSLTSDTREAPKTIRQSFNQAFADAKAAGLKKFTWVNPATGKAMVYTTQIARKEGGRVPSLANPDDWIDADEKPKAKKSAEAKKPAKSDGTAIVNRALMLSSKKS